MSLNFDPAKPDFRAAHYIGGTYVEDAPSLPMFRPSDGQEFAGCPVASEAMVDRAVQTAKAALKSSGWGSLRPRERTEALLRWAALLEKNAPQLAQLEAVPSTRLIGQLIAGDVAITVEQIRFFAELADKEGGDVAPTAAGHLGMTITEPFGVVGAITPWNFPVSMAGWKLGPALAAGNAVVLKPSEMTPFSSLLMADLATQAGIPAGLINVVLGDGPTTGNAITGHEDIAKVSFTGSTRAGQAIMENIARTGMKPMTLELGGKSPQIVFEDADLTLAADNIARSILFNAGQACVAGSRVLVHERLVQPLTEALIERMSDVRPGPAWDETTTYSAIISETQTKRMEKILQKAQTDGADLLLGGHRFDHPGYFFEPTLIANVSQDSPVVREEVFGPVLTVQTFADDEEAMTLADHPVYGLCAGIYTSNLSRALKTMKTVQAGTIWVNRYGRSRDHILPTGGYKASGFGKDLGKEAYRANRQSKTVLIDL